MPELPCFCHPDGSLRDSPKSKIFQYFKGLVQLDSPPNVETMIADGMFFIKSIRRCHTYRLFFVQTVSTTVLKQTDICFDVYESPSLKDSKRQEGGMTNSNVSFPLDHNKICQVISTNYGNYPALRKNYLDFSLRKLNIQSML